YRPLPNLDLEPLTGRLVSAVPQPRRRRILLDRLINNSHQLLMNGASYRPHKRPGRVATPETTTTS
ncbi:MAG TPA: hypothetical protein VK390_03265, partial [Propionibacteriaceae bacterium]|nr:hypothetical protein [Propionibacteriaceae bacterium]